MRRSVRVRRREVILEFSREGMTGCVSEEGQSYQSYLMDAEPGRCCRGLVEGEEADGESYGDDDTALGHSGRSREVHKVDE